MDNANQKIKEHEEDIGENEIKKDILDKVCGHKVKNICSEKDEVYKNKNIIIFIKILNKNKRELQSNKQLLCRKKTIVFR